MPYEIAIMTVNNAPYNKYWLILGPVWGIEDSALFVFIVLFVAFVVFATLLVAVVVLFTWFCSPNIWSSSAWSWYTYILLTVDVITLLRLVLFSVKSIKDNVMVVLSNKNYTIKEK